MADLGLEQMQAIQRELQEKYKNIWQKRCPATGRDSLLWMMAEAGEVAEIIKKKGDNAIMTSPDVRAHFIEEMCDTMMYLNDLALCYNITPDEITKAYLEKHKKNMSRW